MSRPKRPDVPDAGDWLVMLLLLSIVAGGVVGMILARSAGMLP